MKLVSIIVLAIALTLAFARPVAADTVNGAKVFSANCAIRELDSLTNFSVF